MDIWKILDTQPTADKDELKKAYRARLSHVNPEDNQSGFMELREAYEEALRLAENGGAAEEADTGGKTDLEAAFETLYGDFYRRIDIDSWRELFNRDEFVALDKSYDAECELLKFLMTHIYLPKKIWHYIVDTIDIKGRKKELAEIFPEDFLEYVINNSEYDDLINYYLFDGDKDGIDEYIENYYRLDAAIRKRDIDAEQQYIDMLHKLDVYHPYLTICEIRRDIQLMNISLEEKNKDGRNPLKMADFYADELKKLMDRALELLSDTPDDITVINTCGDIKMLEERFEEAGEYYDRAKEISPDNYVVKGKQAELLYCMKQYAESRDAFMELLTINHYDNNARAGMIRANQALIAELTDKLEENPDDSKIKLEIAWSMYQSYRFKDAVELLDGFLPSSDKECEYYNVKGRSYLCLDDYDNALLCFRRWRDCILSIPKEDDSKESADKKKRFEYANFLIGECYLKTGRYDEARSCIGIALAKEHDEIVLSYEAMCELEYRTENYDACIKACEDLLCRDDKSYIAYNYMSKAYLEIDYLKDSLTACERAIALYPYVADPYETEVRIFLKINQPDTAMNVIDRFRKLGIESDRADFSQACIYEYEKKYDEAVKILVGAIERSDEKNTDMDDFYELHMMLGFNYDKMGEKQKAKELYENVIVRRPTHRTAYGMLARLVRDEGDYRRAIELFNKQIEIRPQPFYYIQRGLLHRFLMNYKSALSDFNEALSAEPDNSFVYLKAGQIYELHRDFDRAVEYYENALNYETDDEQIKTIMLAKARTLQCMNRFDDSRAVYEAYRERFGVDADMAYDYAELLHRMKLSDYAARLLLKVINGSGESDVSECIRQLCYIYGAGGYIDKAYEAMMLAVSKNPKNAGIYGEMGTVFFNHGLIDDARRMYEQAVLLDIDNNQNYYSELIETVLAKKTFFKPDIREYTKKAIIPVSDIRCPVDLIKMSRLNRVLKKYREAINIIDKALGMRRCRGCFYGKCHEALYHKGLILEAMKQYNAALACYREALSICGNNPLYEECIKRIEDK